MGHQEKQFETKIKSYLASKGIWYVKYFANAYTKRGIPDILACVKGCFVAIEVKSESGRPSPLQVRNIEMIQESGGIATVLYPKDFEDFKSIVEHLLA